MVPLLDRLVVKVRTWDEAWIAALVASVGGRVALRMEPIRWLVVEIDHTRAADLFRSYEQTPGVEDVWLDEEAKPAAAYNFAFNDPLLDRQWNLHRMNVLPAWKHATARGAGITAAVLDSGLDEGFDAKPGFAGKIIHHWSGHYDAQTYEFIGEDEIPVTMPATIEGVTRSGPLGHHGLATMGLLLADGTDDGVGMVGVAPKANLVNMAIWQAGGVLPTSAMINGMLRAVNPPPDMWAPAKVISMSAGALSATPIPATGPWPDTLAYLQPRALVFVAAGNDSASPEDYAATGVPGSYLPSYGGFNVGCLTHEEVDGPAHYSNYGAPVNLAAPGHQVWTPLWHTTPAAQFLAPEGWTSLLDGAITKVIGQVSENYRQFNGTSAACPLAAGVAALIWSLNPAWDVSVVRAIMQEAQDRPTSPAFKRRFPNAGVPNALKGVLRGKAILSPGTVLPYVGFQGPGVTTTVAAGVATLHLRGPLLVELDGYSTDPITNVKLYAGATLIYDGPPRKGDNALSCAAHLLAVGDLRVVASTASASGDETYTDIVAHEMPAGPLAPPKTRATPGAGQVAPGASITLTAESDAHPVRISYRWGAGAWQRYSAPIAAQEGTLQFYGVDALGNVEGGVDHDPDA